LTWEVTSDLSDEWTLVRDGTDLVDFSVPWWRVGSFSADIAGVGHDFRIDQVRTDWLRIDVAWVPLTFGMGLCAVCEFLARSTSLLLWLLWESPSAVVQSVFGER